MRAVVEGFSLETPDQNQGKIILMLYKEAYIRDATLEQYACTGWGGSKL